ncbi:MAG: hypothetical protein AB9869_30475 [Verrucomicrobiia bacterium]
MDLGELKKLEEAKRAAAYDPVARWLHIQQTITWAEENMPVHLRRNRPRTRAKAAADPANGGRC